MGTGYPHAAEPQRMDGVQEIHGGGPGGEQLLDFRNRRVGIDFCAHADQHRHGGDAVPQTLDLVRRRILLTLSERLDEHVGEGRPGGPVDQNKTPWTQAPVIRRAQTGVEDEGKIGVAGRRRLQSADGLARQQCLDDRVARAPRQAVGSCRLLAPIEFRRFVSFSGVCGHVVLRHWVTQSICE